MSDLERPNQEQLRESDDPLWKKNIDIYNLIIVDGWKTVAEDMKIQEAYEVAKGDGFPGTRKEFEEKLLGKDEFEKEIKELSLPSKVIERLIRDYENEPRSDRQDALEKAQKINMIKENKEKGNGNTVEIMGDTFSWLRPEVNGEDVFKGEVGEDENGVKYDYRHVIYIVGDAIEKYAGDEEILEDVNSLVFIEKNVPGRTMMTKVENFADLLGLELSGCRTADGKFILVGEYGRAWSSRSNGDHAFGFEIGAAGGATFADKSEHAMPVIVREKSAGE